MRIALSGSSGLVGSLLCKSLEEQGHTILRLVRSASNSDDECHWNWRDGTIEENKLEGIDCCIHLAGENIATRRWSSRQKQLIRESRVRGTKLIADACARLSTPPTVFLCASAVGYYGSRGDQLLTEESTAGEGFLANICLDWEEAARAVEAAGTRVVQLRIGMVVDPAGGALKKMLLPFRLGLGGQVGNGKQFISWISNHDLCRAICFILEQGDLSGPVNLVAPEAVTNREFTQLLGKALRRPTLIPLPAPLVRLLFGELGEATLLASTRVAPEKLAHAGFSFMHATLASALEGLSS